MKINKCQYCHKEYEWDEIKYRPKGCGLGFDFFKFCSKECSKSYKVEKTKQTNLKRYGVENPAQAPQIRNKIKQTCLERYGAENVYASEYGKSKIKQTCIKRYGTEYVSQTPEVKEKIKQTNLERYGVEHSSQFIDVKKKIKQTNLERYGAECTLKTEQGKQKIQKTNLEKYGTKNAMQNSHIKEKMMNTWKNRHGGIGWAVEKILEKTKQTTLERYGVENSFQSKEVRELWKQNCLKKYGVDSPTKTPEYRRANSIRMRSSEVQKKIHETKKRNGTYKKKSSSEQRCFELLQYVYPDVNDTRDPDTRYPFKVDFYIPSLDLFIEYQGHQSHGKRPYDPTNPKHLELVETWTKKSKEINIHGKPKKLYANMVETWTIRDPKKRQWAKNYNLNWLEFFTVKELEDWLAKT